MTCSRMWLAASLVTCFKCRHQIVRQVANKPYGICKYGFTDICNVNTPQRRVEGGKQLVCRVDPRFGDAIEKGRFTGVGISHQRNSRNVGFDTRLPPLLTLLFNLSRRDCICTMRLRNKRRSVSSWVSPGPRKPIPPFCLSRWVQPRTRRVARWRSCASSTCNLPSWVRARWAKISKIRPVRSITRHSHKRSRLRSCAGLRAWSKRTTEAPVALTASAISTALPSPTNTLGAALYGYR